MYKVIIGIVVVAIMAIVAFMIIDPHVNVSRVNDTSLIESNLDGAYTVTVEGEVENPGTYNLEGGSTIKDLLNAAGGATSSADSRCYYEEVVLEDKATYYVPGMYDFNDICNNSEVNKVNINIDDAETLMSVDAIKSSIAASIVSYRTTNGLFKTLEELQNVYGIGAATYKKLRDYVILHK
ncbi:MAG: helix-hairpin-helix domain-containing protein [Bacilli bacterium]|nr:helix-hairpin-helix domain-containing protein [Bacilli bacterium]